jgi:pimeloyl-ACP methyl ester carboxylesterase
MVSDLTRTVVFIQGAWMTPESWDNFRKPFEAAGYKTHAPSWPYLDGTAAELRAKPPAALGNLSVGAIVDHYQTFIATLPEKPLIIGHSFGGLYTQILLDRGIGAAGIAIDPGPIGGIVPGPVSLAAALPVIARWEGWSRPYTLTPEGFAKNFANTAPGDLQKSAYERFVVPTSGRIFYQAAAWIGTFVHPKRRTQPLLITAAEKDRTVTPYVAHAAYEIQRHARARTDFTLFLNRSHFLIAEPGWEGVANFALNWAKGL